MRAVVAYGLTDVHRRPAQDPSLTELAELARRASGADGAAIHIMDGGRQTVLACSPPTALRVSPRNSSICQWALELDGGAGTIAVGDASLEPELRDNPWVSGELAKVRFYAAAPLLDDDGWALGTVCVWSAQPSDNPTAPAKMLEQVRDAVMVELEARRLRTELSSSVEPRHEPLSLVPSPDKKPTWSIDTVIDDRAIRTLFQPIVHLATGEVVGFEALSRGPAGTPLESAEAMLSAARAARRLGELDWVCRIHALQAVTASGLPSNLSWFVNVEPAGLSIECPPHLRPALAQARRDLRVVLEMVERDIDGDVAGLLHATDQARRDAWGVALDDVGAQQASLALLPFLQPDVVKLDMSLIHGSPRPAAARVTAAVSAYAERTGAAILVEGIETEEQEQLAAVFGATYGQGFRFGRPGPLPTTVAVPHHVVPLRQRPENVAGNTPFEVLSRLHAPQTSTKRHLLHISTHLEAQATTHNEAAVILVGFQRSEFFSAGKQALYRELATRNAFTVVVADDVAPVIDARYQVIALPPESRSRSEWQMIIVSPHYAAAFVGRDLGDDAPDGDRRFDFIYTHDREAVIAAGRAYLEHLGPSAVRGS
jgi:EAL domain-containing protein (putative c-di-GMP-specific phosphodiesterase class I)